uniref:Uncharacterized protein n=1 Tax=Anopheles farauti TaxID=69004 RepID=A0A182QM05_9DIPT
MSSSFRIRTSLVLLVIVALVGTQCAILSRAIEAQKSLVEREEQALQEAKDQVYRTAQNAIDVSRDAVSNVAEQVKYAVMYPWRRASEALEKPKLYAKYMLYKATNALTAGDATTPVPVVLTEEYRPQYQQQQPEQQEQETEIFPQLISGLRMLFKQDPTDEAKALPKPSPLIEVIEIKQSPSVELITQPPMVEADKEPQKEVIVI